MRIARAEIKNFKSFVSTGRIDFPPGFTVIVGQSSQECFGGARIERANACDAIPGQQARRCRFGITRRHANHGGQPAVANADPADVDHTAEFVHPGPDFDWNLERERFSQSHPKKRVPFEAQPFPHGPA